jgi:hypothetical protein
MEKSPRRTSEAGRGGVNILHDSEDEQWRNLCEQAATEKDLVTLLQLVREINRLLIKRLLQEREGQKTLA